MYAVIKTGGKQYRVSQGDRIRVESLAADEGASVNLDEVLMIGEGASVTVGEPLIADASVSARVLAHGRGKKVSIIKFRRRKQHRKQMGHRQNYTELEITGISGAGISVTEPAKAAEPKKAEAKPKAPAKPAAEPKAESKAVKEEAPAASAAPLKFLDGPDGEPDDLKKILGIGPVIEEQLNEMGIYHYSQIAAFSQTDVDNINEALAFPGRRERDEWIEQAQGLASGGEARQLRYLDAPNGDPDDLKEISGIGPVIEEKLNSMGIYHFSQIAAFTDRDIELVNNGIDFPGRIERDSWLEQAAELAKG